jgi:hypothetical protein
MTKRFAHGNSANLKFRGNRILTKLFPLPQFAAENFLSQPFQYGGSEGLTRDRCRFSRWNCICGLGQEIVNSPKRSANATPKQTGDSGKSPEPNKNAPSRARSSRDIMNHFLRYISLLN